MPLSALGLVLLAALLHASWNFVAKTSGGDQRFAFISAVMVVVIWAPLALWLGWQELPRWGWAEWGFVAASALVHVLYMTALLRGYREADLTVVYPVARGSGPLVTAAAAVLLLGERLSLAGVLGVLAVCGGVFLIAGGPRMARVQRDRARLHAGLRWGGLTGLTIAAYSVIDGYAVKVMLMGPVLLDYFSYVLRLPLLAPLAWAGRAGFGALLRAQWRAALVVSLLSPLAYILVLYALQQAPLSHVAPAREVSMLLAALLGGRLLGEADRGLRLAGAVCIAGGVAALAVG